MHAAPSHAPVTIELPPSDARALSALVTEYERTQNELRHARETHHRRGDDPSHERVLDLECEATCAAQRIAQTIARVLGPAFARGAAS
jgi:hypothetical protein